MCGVCVCVCVEAVHCYLVSSWCIARETCLRGCKGKRKSGVSVCVCVMCVEALHCKWHGHSQCMGERERDRERDRQRQEMRARDR